MPRKGYKQSKEHRERTSRNLKNYYSGHTPHNKKYNIPKSDKKRYVKNHSLMRSFGINIEQYEEMIVVQQNRCGICGGYQRNEKSLAVDHNHTTGKIRGLLCDDCNFGIGFLKDNEQILRNAIDYLRLGSRDSDDKD